MTYKWIYILISGLSLTSSVVSQERFPALSPLLRETQLVATGTDTLFELGDRFLLRQNFSIRLDSLILVEGKDYRVDYSHGLVRFFNPPDSGQYLTIQYHRLPVFLNRSYHHWQAQDSMETTQDTLSMEPVISRQGGRSSDPPDLLSRSGSIFRGVRLGTDQGMRLQSGLRLQVSGKIASNIDILGSLTDQNTPIQPEGNTQTLQEIDKVFVEIRTPGLKATLGDYAFMVSGTEFGSYERKLQGVMGRAENEHGHITVSAAASKGSFTTNTFLGRESNQGPYQLTGPQGRREIIVLAGTEKVWIDGERMVRGEENDYTIEYANGQVIFTRHRLISDDSRITVDFEYSDQEFQKELYGGEGELSLWNDRFKIRASFLREADDGENPLDFPLTEENRRILEQAGDVADSAVTSGAVFVGENQGFYTVVDTGGTLHYHYVGVNEGEYDVRFSYVGEGQGSYSLQGYGVFLYEGEGKGDYDPLRYLPVAKRHQVANFASTLQIAKGVVVEGEVAVSDIDENRYSNRDDKDNVDMAYGGRFRMESQPLRLGGWNLGEIDIRSALRAVGDRFRPVGRMTEIEHGRKWGIEEGVVWGED